MSSRAWMPLYVGDYLADTSHLDAESHGVYLLLLMRCWTKGSIPQDRMQCMSIAHAMHEHSKSIVDAILDEYFVLHEDGYHNKRIDIEREKAGIAYDRRAGAAKVRWEKERATRCIASALQMQPQPQPQPQPQQEPKPEPKTKKAPKTFSPPSLEDVVDHCVKHFPTWHHSSVRELYRHYVSTGWTDRDGKPVGNWKNKFSTIHGYKAEKGTTGPTKEWSDSQQSQQSADYFNERLALLKEAEELNGR